MPAALAKKRARRAARQGKRPTTQAGEFVREEMHKLKEGSGTVRSRKQVVAIGLSGVKLDAPRRGQSSAQTRAKARRDRAIGSGKIRPSRTRSLAAKKAARTRARRYAR